MNRHSPLPAFAIALAAVALTGCAVPQASGTNAVPPPPLSNTFTVLPLTPAVRTSS